MLNYIIGFLQNSYLTAFYGEF